MRLSNGGCPASMRSFCRCMPAVLTTGDIAAHFAEIFDAQVSKDTISRITDRVVEEMQAWTSRPLERGSF